MFSSIKTEVFTSHAIIQAFTAILLNKSQLHGYLDFKLYLTGRCVFQMYVYTDYTRMAVLNINQLFKHVVYQSTSGLCQNVREIAHHLLRQVDRVTGISLFLSSLREVHQHLTFYDIICILGAIITYADMPEFSQQAVVI